MLKSDFLIKAITKCGSFRAIAVSSKYLTAEARERHNLSHTATVTLGRALTCGILLCNTLRKDKGHLTLKLTGNGPIGNVIVDASNKGLVRGYVGNPQIECFDEKGYVSVSQALGIGLLHVSYNNSKGLPYTGTTILTTSEVADDVVNYLGKSEQIFSFISCGVYLDPKTGEVKHAGGIIIQRMPDAKESVLDDLEENLAKLDPFSILLRSKLSLEEIIKKALCNFDVDIIEEFKGLCFHCPCTKDSFDKALSTLTAEEKNKIIEEVGHIEGTCHFCGKKYIIEEKSD